MLLVVPTAKQKKRNRLPHLSTASRKRRFHWASKYDISVMEVRQQGLRYPRYDTPNASAVCEKQKKVVDAQSRISRDGHQLSQPSDAFGDGAGADPGISNLRH